MNYIAKNSNNILQLQKNNLYAYNNIKVQDRNDMDDHTVKNILSHLRCIEDAKENPEVVFTDGEYEEQYLGREYEENSEGR